MKDGEYEVTYYELKQICLTQEFQGVWFSDEKQELFADVLDAIGLAEESTRVFSRDGNVVENYPPTMEVVGLVVLDGLWDIVNEAANYAGMCRVGEDISEATGHLDWEKVQIAKAAAAEAKVKP